ncbi:hypothetical protein J9332_36805, partial [Aquimarina celericrescens]|nr:hypothetical protein [Aquimarina celericrescens]
MKTIQKSIRFKMIPILVGTVFFFNSCSTEEFSEEVPVDTSSVELGPDQAVPNSYIVLFKEDGKLKSNKQQVSQKSSSIL